ncbi:MAG: PEP-CTERM sorting domain-containing protein [Candidatus Thiodiazotropha sp. (ex Epidulcina cf. delphinae)]|nr:PEP-CTERM sorting domain-containing protein [Candidatus Thiodiazotropha sp. (ex Epidulcina cf. delphinae)]
MKHLFKYSPMLLLLSLASPACLAVAIDEAGPYFGTDVGDPDIFLFEADKQGNPTNEVAWVNSMLGSPIVSYTVKTENVSYLSTDTANVFAFLLQSTEPDYYLIKNAQRVALFQNVASLDWGVFDTTLLSGAMNLPSDGFQISHVTELSGGASIPEPSTLALMGISLIGLGFRGRKKLRS